MAVLIFKRQEHFGLLDYQYQLQSTSFSSVLLANWSVYGKKKNWYCNIFNQTDDDVFYYCFISPRYLLYTNSYFFIGEDLQEGRVPMLNLSGLRRMLKQQLQQMKTFITRSSIHAVKIIIKIYRYIDNC